MHVEICLVAELYADPNFQAMIDEYASYAIKSLPKPQYRQQDYERMERLGLIVPFRAVHENQLIGFMGVVQATMPHYGFNLSIVESLFVRKAFRNTLAGVALIKKAESFAAASGSSGLFINSPVDGELLEILPKLKYNLETHNFFKRL